MENKMKYKLVIFDWDGTLMDSAGKIVSSMQSAARLGGAGIPSDQAVKDIIGLSLDVAVRQLFPAHDSPVHQVIHDHYKDQYRHHDQTPTPMFAGATDLLIGLKSSGYKLAVATGKGRRGLDRVLHQSQTVDLFEHTRCADEAESKPSPDMLQQLLTAMDVQAHEAVMIGDTEYDMAMAKAINMDRIGVSFGVHSRERLQAQTPIAVIDQLIELRGLV